MAQTIFSVSIKNLLLAFALSLLTLALPGEDTIADDGLANGTVRLSGRVTVAGRYPKPQALPVFKNRDFCGPQVINETLIIGNGGGLKNAVVIVRPVGRQATVRAHQLSLDNQHCAFAPHVQVAPVGSELLLLNSDPILHTVHARMGSETLFNVGLPTWRRVTKRLDRAGVIKIDCDVLHTWMSAAIIVTDSPYYAVTDVGGFFSISGLPAGDYDVDVWHEKLGVKSRRLSMTSDERLSLDVVYAVNQMRR